jgi:hypothetical protein
MPEPDDPGQPGLPFRWERPPFPHASGRVCFWRATWAGDPHTGHWRWGYWYRDPEQLWRYCGQDHDA